MDGCACKAAATHWWAGRASASSSCSRAGLRATPPRSASCWACYGEWLYAKHTVFYTDLPHYLLEFDCYDRDADAFLSTARRRDLQTVVDAGSHWTNRPLLTNGLRADVSLW